MLVLEVVLTQLKIMPKPVLLLETVLLHVEINISISISVSIRSSINTTKDNAKTSTTSRNYIIVRRIIFNFYLGTRLHL